MLDRVSSPSPATREDRIVLIDGAMGRISRSLDDFAGHVGRHRNVTWSDVVRTAPWTHLEAVETNTFGVFQPRPDHPEVKYLNV
jgi:hypothetical protein